MPSSTDAQLLTQLQLTLKALEQQSPTQRLALLLKVRFRNNTDMQQHYINMRTHFTQVADTAYRAGVAKLQAGQTSQAQQLLQLAAAACPENKANARRKIQQALTACESGGRQGGGQGGVHT